MGVELLAVIGDDAGRLLAAMLQRMQAERGQRRRVGMAVDAEHAAFLVQMIGVAGISHPRARHPQAEGPLARRSADRRSMDRSGAWAILVSAP